MDPSWRIKTRPCPFYSQGKCLFADSCNFRHSAVIKATINPEVALLRELQTKSPRTPAGTRSPRIDGLLLALSDVIAPEEEEESYEEEASFDSSVSYEPCQAHTGEESYTLYDDSQMAKDLKTLKTEDDSEPSPPIPAPAPALAPPIPTAVVSAESPAPASPIPAAAVSTEAPDHDDSVAQEVFIPSTPANSHLLSPVTATLPQVPFALDRSSSRASVYTLDGAEEWHSPRPMQLEPPRSPAMSSTFDILASPFRSPSMRIASSQFGSFLSFLQPGAFEGSSDLSPNGDIEELDLDSPVATPEPKLVPDISEAAETPVASSRQIIQTTEDSPASVVKDTPKSPIVNSDEHTAVANGSAAANSPIAPVEEQVASTPIMQESTVEESPPQGLLAIANAAGMVSPPAGSFVIYHPDEVDSSPPEPFATQDFPPDESVNLSPYRNLLDHHNSIHIAPETVDEWEEGTPGEQSFYTDDVTAQLPYLQDTPDDTIHSLYEIYSDISSSPESSSPQLPPLPQSPAQEPSSDSGSPYFSGHEHVDVIPRFDEPHAVDVMPRPDEPHAFDERPPVFSHPMTPVSARGSIKSPVYSARSPPSFHRSMKSISSVHSSVKSPVFSPKSPPSIHRSAVDALSPQHSNDPPMEQSPPPPTSARIPFGFRKAPVTTDTSSVLSEPVVRSARPDSLQADDARSDKMGISKPPAGLKPLRLSVIVNSRPPSPPQSSSSSNSNASEHFAVRSAHRGSPESSVSSPVSNSNNFNAPSARASCGQLPRHDEPSTSRRVSLRNSQRLSTTDIRSAPLRRDSSWGAPPSAFYYPRPSSRISEPISRVEEEDVDADTTLIAPPPATASLIRSSSAFALHPPDPITRPLSAFSFHPATPRPDLLFALASDDVDQVRVALENGNVTANDQVGPQCALAFTLSNDQITNKLDIVKTLLAYGADPNALDDPALNPPARSPSGVDPDQGLPSLGTNVENLDPATRYYVSRAKSEAMQKNRALVQRTEFQPLARVCFDLVGQDLAFEQLFRALNTRSKQRKPGPVVAVLCGPSGHGKSFVAHRFSSLLNIPSHTVNLTTVRTPGDLWKSFSMDPNEDVISQLTLEEFLIENEGRPCVVVLDEIEKTAKENLFSLLVPFELGRCPIEAGKRHVDVRRVTWLATSNIGQETVFEFDKTRITPDKPISRQEYLQLTTTLRDQVSEHLGASLLSRVTCVLPFVPFSTEELRAIAAESVMSLGGEEVSRLNPSAIGGIIDRALLAYVAREGARSLYRADRKSVV